LQCTPVQVAPRLRGLCHRLVQQGILSRQPPHRLLVELDDPLAPFAKRIILVECLQPIADVLPEFVNLPFIHDRDGPHQGFAFRSPDPICYLAVVKGGRQMAETRMKLAEVDPVWARIAREADEAVAQEPLLGGMVHYSILHHPTIERALSYRISLKLANGEMSEQIIREICDEAYSAEPDLAHAARADITATYERDPACHRYLQPLLFFKGFQAVQAYRVAHWLWTQGRKDLAYFFQMRSSEVFGIDIHPAARIGRGIMIDHAHSIVIGETAVVGDNVSMLHSVTLGGTGKEDADRHPKIGNNVLIGAGAKVLGNITVGHCSRIAAGSVVLKEVPPCTTVAGVPAKIVGEAGCDQPSKEMDQILRGETLGM
jgi:serine O-acetyltransferase